MNILLYRCAMSAVLCLGLSIFIVELAARKQLDRISFGDIVVDWNWGDILPVSHATLHGHIDLCLGSLAPVPRQLMTTSQRLAAIEQCQELASHVRRFWPSDARADLLLAAVAATSDDAAVSLKHLYTATRAATYQGWMAETRLIDLLALDASRLTRSELGGWADLIVEQSAILLTTDRGADLIAEWYVRRPGLRSVLRPAIEAAEEQDRKRVLTRIRLKGHV